MKEFVNYITDHLMLFLLSSNMIRINTIYTMVRIMTYFVLLSAGLANTIMTGTSYFGELPNNFIAVEMIIFLFFLLFMVLPELFIYTGSIGTVVASCLFVYVLYGIVVFIFFNKVGYVYQANEFTAFSLFGLPTVIGAVSIVFYYVIRIARWGIKRRDK